MTRPARAQTIESPAKPAGDRLGHNVSGGAGSRAGGNEAGLHAPTGERKYVNRAERSRILGAMEKLPTDQSLFSLVLAWTGARVSEILALSPDSFQIETAVVTIITLKRRKTSIREVPIPPALMARLAHHYSLKRVQRSSDAFQKLWPWCRVTAWRRIQQVCHSVGVFGLRASPRGLRHGFGIGALQNRVPLTLIQRLMGHAKLSTTAIYLSVSGPDEANFLKPFWSAYKAPARAAGDGTHATP
jgi:integrase/recombinase XerD